MYQIELYEDVGGNGLKKTAELATASLKDALTLWTTYASETRAPGSFATFFSPDGELARRTWDPPVAVHDAPPSEPPPPPSDESPE